MFGGGGESTAGGMSSLMKKYDKDGDGELDRSELPGALFDRLDANRDGFVTFDEARSQLRRRESTVKQ